MPNQAPTEYIAALRKIIADDPIAGPIYAERAALIAEISPTLEQLRPVRERISTLTNRLNNVSSHKVHDALRALSKLRVEI